MAPTRTRDSATGSEEEEQQETPFRADFNQKVYACVRRIPEGKVCSYGQIAKLIGHPRHSRLVGTALKVLPRSLASPYILPPAPSSSSVTTSRATSNASTSRPPSNIDFGGDDTVDEPFTSSSTSNDFLVRIASTSSSATAAAPLPPKHNDAEQDEDRGEDDVLPAPLPNPSVVPWWRVVSQTGVISPRGSSHAVERQADYLRAEGVVVRDGPRNGGGGGGGGGPAETVDAFGLGGAVAGGRVSMAKFSWKGP
ncbi:hypothetical protein JCM11251_001631 [Rhodosporidiobolus azoricus]